MKYTTSGKFTVTPNAVKALNSKISGVQSTGRQVILTLRDKLTEQERRNIDNYLKTKKVAEKSLIERIEALEAKVQ